MGIVAHAHPAGYDGDDWSAERAKVDKVAALQVDGNLDGDPLRVV